MIRAFSLIDAVFGITVLGIGLVGVMVPMRNSGQAEIFSEQISVALNLASDTLEQIKARRDSNTGGGFGGYDNMLTAVGPQSSSTSVYDQNPISGSIYSVNAWVLEVDPANGGFSTAQPGSGYARVTARVSWNNGNSLVTLSMLLTKYN